MSVNPYQAPEQVSDGPDDRKVLRWYWRPLKVVFAVFVVDLAFWAHFWLFTPPPGDPIPYSVSVPYMVYLLINLPGFPLFFAIERTGLIPIDNDMIRSRWFVACSTISWGFLALLASPFVRIPTARHDTSTPPTP
jgi:hypothetical protein